MTPPQTSDLLLLMGLLIEVLGVFILVRTSDRGFNFLLKNLNGVVSDDWNDKIKKIHRRNKLQTIYGIAILTTGVLMQYYGILIEKISF